MGKSSCEEKFEEVSLEKPKRREDSSAENKFSYLQEQVADEDFGTFGLKRAHKNTLEPKMLSPVKSNLLITEETPSKRSPMPKSFIKESMRRIRESSQKKTDGSPSIQKLPGLLL